MLEGWKNWEPIEKRSDATPLGREAGGILPMDTVQEGHEREGIKSIVALFGPVLVSCCVLSGIAWWAANNHETIQRFVDSFSQ